MYSLTQNIIIKKQLNATFYNSGEHQEYAITD